MIRLALSQINVTVGDLAGNRDKILDHIHRARGLGAHIVVFPELAIPGYPPEDLLFKPRFIQSNLDVLNELVRTTQGVAAVFGFVDRHDDIYNAAAIACDGRLIDVYHKTYLPNYGVFDEDRYFQSGKTAGVVPPQWHHVWGYDLRRYLVSRRSRPGASTCRRCRGADQYFFLSFSRWQRVVARADDCDARDG